MRFHLASAATLNLHVSVPEELAAADDYLVRLQRIGPRGEAIGEERGADSPYRKLRRFVWRKLEPGTYRLRIGWGMLQGDDPFTMSRAHLTRTIAIHDGVNDHSAGLPLPDPGEIFVLRVLDDEGNQLTGVRFCLHWEAEGGGGAHMRRREALRGKSGLYYLAGLPGVDEKTGRYTIEAQHDRFGVIAAPARLAAEEPIELRFDKPVRLRVRVRAIERPELRERLRVELRPAGSDETPWRVEGDVDADEHATLRPQQPGDYELLLHLRAPGGGWMQIARSAHKLSPRAAEAELFLPPLHPLRVVWKGKGRPRIVAWTDAPSPWTAGVGDDGVALFDALPAGTYRVQAERGQAIEVIVPAQSEITLR